MKEKILCIGIALAVFCTNSVVIATEFDKNTVGNLNALICNPEPDLVPSLLKQGVDPHIKLPGNGSFLQMAVISCANIDCIEELIYRGVDVNSQDDNGSSAMMVAIACAVINKERYDEYIEIVKFLIKNGADVNLCAKDGTFILQTLCDSKENNRLEELITILLEAGANPNISNSGFFVLHSAIASKASLSIIQKLLKFGADPNGKETVPAFIEGIDPQGLALFRKWNTPLQRAIIFNADPIIVESLLQAQANPNQVSTGGFSPLDTVIIQAYHQTTPTLIQITKLLIKYGANPPIRDVMVFAENNLGKGHPIVDILTKWNLDE